MKIIACFIENDTQVKLVMKILVAKKRKYINKLKTL